MQKTPNKRLAFKHETIRPLDRAELAGVVGGTATTAINCTVHHHNTKCVATTAVNCTQPATTAPNCTNNTGGPATTAIQCH